MPNSKPTLTINEAALKLGVSNKTLRRWEKAGKLAPQRTKGGHRRYSEEQIENFKKLKKLKSHTTLPFQSVPEVQERRSSTAFSAVNNQENSFPSTLNKVTSHPITEPNHLSLPSNAVITNPKKSGYAENRSNHLDSTPPLYTDLFHQDQLNFGKRALKFFVITALLLITLKLISLPFTRTYVSESLERVASNVSPASPVLRQIASYVRPTQEKTARLASDQNLNVLALTTTSLEDQSFNVYVETNLRNDVTVDGLINANGGEITTTSETFELLNTVATTLNIGGETTELNLGADTGTTTINNELLVDDNLTVEGVSNDIAGILNLSGNTLTTTADLVIDPEGGGVSIGTATPGNIDLAGDDFFVSGDIEIDGTSYIPTLVIGGDTITEFVGTGLQVSGGTLSSTLGTAIDSSEITDDTILEADLNVSNTGTNGQILSYNSSTGGFTWVADSTGSTVFTSTGSLVHLDTSTDNVTIGSETELSKFAIDGDTDEVQLLVQGNGTQTANLAVLEQSDGTDVLTVGNTGTTTLTNSGSGNVTFNLTSTGDFVIQDGGSTFATFTDGGGFNLDNLSLDGNTLSSTSGNLVLSPSGSLVFSGLDCSGNSNGGALTADASGVITCTNDDGGAGGYSNWTLDGDSGTSQPIDSGNTATFTGGTGIDTSVGATDELTIAFDSTELGDLNWGDSSNATLSLSPALSGATDPALTFGNNSITLANAGTLSSTSTTALNLGAATIDFDGAGSLQYGNGSNFTITDDGGNNIFALTGASDLIQFGNATDNNAFTFLGSGQTTFNGNIDATSGLDVTGASLTVGGNATITTAGAAIFASTLSVEGLTIGLNNDADTDNLIGLSAAGGEAGSDLYWGNDLICDVSETNCGWQSGSSAFSSWVVEDDDADQYSIVDGNILAFTSTDGNVLTNLTNGDDGDENLDFSIRLLGDVVAGSGLSGGADNVLVGADSDTTFNIGAGNGITVNADDVAVNQDYDFTFTGNLTLTPAGSDNLDINLDSDSLLTIDQTFTGSTTASSTTITGTNTSTSGTQNLLYLDNAASTGTTESALVIDNSDTDTAVTNGIQFIDAGGGFTNLFNVGGTLISPSEFTVLDSGIALSSEVTGILPLANGGTGASLADPNADRIFFWDDDAGSTAFLAPDGTSIEISGTTLQLVDGSSQASVNNSGTTVIQDITLDTYGRVTGLTSTDLSSSFDNYASWTLAGDSGSSQTISSGNTASIVGGTNGIDTVASATDTLTLNLDTTEIGTTTFGSGSGFTWTFDAGSTDPSFDFGDNDLDINVALSTFSGTIAVEGSSIGLNNDADSDNLIALSAAAGQAGSDLYWGDDLICDVSETNCGWVTSGGSGSSKWSVNTTPTPDVTYLTETTFDLAVGGNDSEAPLFVDVSGSALNLNPYGIAAGNTGEIRFQELEAGGDNYTGFKAPDALAGDVIYTLPTDDGSTNQVLATDSSGNLSWIDVSAGSGGYSGWTLSDGTTSQGIASGNTVTISDSSTVEGVVSATDTLTYNVVANSLNFAQLSDSLTLDAATTITNGTAGDLIVDLTSTGDFVISDNGTPFFTFTDGGALTQAGSGQVSLSGNVNATSGLDVTGASLTVGGTATISTAGVGTGFTSLTVDSILIDGTTLGLSADSDLLSLTSGALTVNGTGTFTGDLATQGTTIGLNNDADTDNVLSFNAASAGAASGDLYWGDDLICDVSESNCGWATSGTAFTQFTVAGDAGGGRTITDSNTLTIAGGTNGIDTVDTDTDTVTINLDTTEIGTTTFGGGSGFTWTFDAGATDPSFDFASDDLDINVALTTFSGTVAVEGTTIGLNNDADPDNLIGLSAAAGSAGSDLYWGDDLVCDVSETNCGWTTAASSFSNWTVADDDGDTYSIADSNILRFTSSDSNILTNLINGDDGDENLDFSIRLLGDAVAGAGLTGGADNVLVGADSDVTFTIGTGNGITVNADDVAVNQDYDFTFTGDVTLTPAGTDNLDFNLDSDSLLTIDQAFTGTTTANSVSLTGTNSSSSGTQNLLYLDNAASTGTTDALLVLDNSDTDTAVTNGIQFIDAGGGFTNLFNVGGTLISASEFNVLDSGIALGSEVTGTLPLANGGTGASLSDPNADRIFFWDDGAGSTAFLAPDGTSIEISGTTLQHVDTSTQASVNNSGTTVIQDITLDTYGHLTGVSSVDLSSSFDNYSSWTFAVDGVNQDAITSGDVLDFVSGSGITVTRSLDDQLTFTAADTSATNELQDLWDVFTADSGSATANSNTDSFAISGGTNGIDTSITGDAVTLNLDTTEIGTTTFGSGSGFTWTFDAGATDPSFDFASDDLDINVALTTFSGTVAVEGTTIGLNNDADADNLIGLSAAAGSAGSDLYWGDDLVCDVSETNCGWTTAASSFSDWTVADDDGDTYAIADSNILRFTSSDSNVLTNLTNGDDGDENLDLSIRLLGDAVAGSGLTGGADNVLVGADSDVTFTVGDGDGITVNADDIDVNVSDGITIVTDNLTVDESYNFAWTGQHSWTNTLTATGAQSDYNLTLGNDGDVDTVSALNFDVTSAATGDADNVRAINIANLTNADGTVNEDAIVVGTGWDSILNYNGTDVIDGTGQLIADQLTGTLFTVAGDSGSGTIIQGDTLTLTGGTGIATSHSGDTNTFSFDCSEVEGTDIDCSGEAITLETTLDSVTTINGLTGGDATTENTIEGFIFDTDAETISGVWTVADNTNFRIGTGGDLTFNHNGTNTTITSTTGDLIFDNTNVTGSTNMVLGTDTSATEFSVLNNSLTPLLTIDSSGQFTLTGGVPVTTILDQDDLSSNSATALATQQSIKAYVDAQIGTSDQNLWETISSDSGSTSANTTTDTLTVAGGTNGIDTSITGDTLTLNLDTTEIGSTTFGSGSGITWTFDAGATDPTIAFASDQMTFTAASNIFSGDITAQGGTFNGASGESIDLGVATADTLTFTTGGSTELLLTGTNLTPGAAEGNSLGSASAEWEQLFLGDNNGVSFGLDQDWSFGYDEATDDRLELVTTGTSGFMLSSAVTTGTGSFYEFDSLTSGTGFLVEYAPASAGTLSGDLFRLNIGANGTVTGDIFAIDDNGSELFSVDQAKITSALPHEFTAAGDVSVAYDLVLTNQTSSKVESYGPLTIQSGESFENNDLTLRTYGTGSVLVEQDLYVGEFTSSGTAALCWDNSGGSYINDCSGSPVSDYAEIYPTESDTGFGELVALGNETTTIDFVTTDENGNPEEATTKTVQKLKKATNSDRTKIIGITSRNYSDFTSTGHNVVNANDKPMPVALSGRVPVKVSSQNGSILAGDPITVSSIPGVAAKANSTGMIIGTALNSYSNADPSVIGEILVFVNPMWYQAETLLSLNGSGDVQLKDGSGNTLLAGNETNLTISSQNISLNGSTTINSNADTLLAAASNGETQFSVDNAGNTELGLEATTEVDPELTGNVCYEQVDDEGTPRYKLVKCDDSGADLAEYYPANVQSVPEAGDIVKVGNPLGTSNQFVVEKTNEEYDSKAIGVVSTKAHTVMGEDILEWAEKAVPVALAGRVPVKVDPNSDPIAAGDRLTTSSVPGRAMKATTTGYTIGKALESWAPESGRDTILVFIENSVYLDQQNKQALENLASNDITIDSIEALLSNIENDQTLMKEALSWEDLANAEGDISVSTLSTEQLYVTDIAAIESLSLGSSLVLGNDFVISSITNDEGTLLGTAIETLDAPLSIQGTGRQPLSIMAGKVTIDTNGNVAIAGDVTIEGYLAAETVTTDKLVLSSSTRQSDDVVDVSSTSSSPINTPNTSIGTAILRAGETSVEIDTSAITENSLIYLTPTSSTLNKVLYLKGKVVCEDQTIANSQLPTAETCTPHFIAGIDGVVSQDIEFNWWIVDQAPIQEGDNE